MVKILRDLGWVELSELGSASEKEYVFDESTSILRLMGFWNTDHSIVWFIPTWWSLFAFLHARVRKTNVRCTLRRLPWELVRGVSEMLFN